MLGLLADIAPASTIQAIRLELVLCRLPQPTAPRRHDLNSTPQFGVIASSDTGFFLLLSLPLFADPAFLDSCLDNHCSQSLQCRCRLVCLSLLSLVPLTLTICRLEEGASGNTLLLEAPCSSPPKCLIYCLLVCRLWLSWWPLYTNCPCHCLSLRQPPRIGPVCWWWMSSLHLACLLTYRCAHGKLSFLPHFAQWRTQFVSLSQLGVTSSAPQQQQPLTPRESEAASDRAFGRQKFAYSANRPLCLVVSLSWPCHRLFCHSWVSFSLSLSLFSGLHT